MSRASHKKRLSSGLLAAFLHAKKSEGWLVSAPDFRNSGHKIVEITTPEGRSFKVSLQSNMGSITERNIVAKIKRLSRGGVCGNW